MSIALQEIEQHWSAIRPIFLIRNEEEYDQAIVMLNDLVDIVGSNEYHILSELMDMLGDRVHAYEEEHYMMPEVKGADALRFLMDEHALKQADLREVGSQGVVSEILNGRRELNTRQIRLLAERFHVSPAVFF